MSRRSAVFRLALPLVLVALGTKTAAAETLEDGLGAFGCEDSRTALRILEPYANNGNELAQYLIGTIYAEGRGGIPLDYDRAVLWWKRAGRAGLLAELYDLKLKDPKSAAFWWRKAAESGDLEAQLILGSRYEGGVGVPKDLVQAYMWLNIYAAQSDRPGSAQVRDSVAANMTGAQIVEAQKLSREWKEAHERVWQYRSKVNENFEPRTVLVPLWMYCHDQYKKQQK
jgi:uncharacterized protein